MALNRCSMEHSGSMSQSQEFRVGHDAHSTHTHCLGHHWLQLIGSDQKSNCDCGGGMSCAVACAKEVGGCNRNPVLI